MTNPSLLGPLMIDVVGKTLTPLEVENLKHPAVGGLILFSRNFDSLEQLGELISEIRSARPNLLIAVDHEGGRVQRFRNGFTHIPAMAKLGALYDEDKKLALNYARELGWLMAVELRCFDIDHSFAPVLDRDYGVSEVIGDRAFSSQVETIVALSSAFISGMNEAGMRSTGKHFPGHGAIAADSHIAIPIDERSKTEIVESDMAIFKSVIANSLDAIMPAHVIYPQVDDSPAGFSKVWVQDILRAECNFKGVVFSDDLSMEGAVVAGSYSERAAAAYEAGCDMALICNNPEAVSEVLADFPSKYISRERSDRIARMLGAPFEQSLPELQSTTRWIKANEIASHLNVTN